MVLGVLNNLMLKESLFDLVVSGNSAGFNIFSDVFKLHLT